MCQLDSSACVVSQVVSWKKRINLICWHECVFPSECRYIWTNVIYVPSCSYNHIPYNILKLPPKFILCPYCLPSVGFSRKNCTESVQDSCPLLKNSLAGAQTKGPLKPYRCFCCKRVLLLMMCGSFEFLILSDRCSIRVMINETTVCCHNRSPSRNRKNVWCVQRDSSTEVHATSAKLHQAQQQLEHESVARKTRKFRA